MFLEIKLFKIFSEATVPDNKNTVHIIHTFLFNKNNGVFHLSSIVIDIPTCKHLGTYTYTILVGTLADKCINYRKKATQLLKVFNYVQSLSPVHISRLQYIPWLILKRNTLERVTLVDITPGVC